jgi:hypothetical protein
MTFTLEGDEVQDQVGAMYGFSGGSASSGLFSGPVLFSELVGSGIGVEVDVRSAVELKDEIEVEFNAEVNADIEGSAGSGVEAEARLEAAARFAVTADFEVESGGFTVEVEAKSNPPFAASRSLSSGSTTQTSPLGRSSLQCPAT